MAGKKTKKPKPKPKRAKTAPKPIGAGEILLLAVWFGVAFGVGEVVLLGVLKISGMATAGEFVGVELGWRTGYIWLSHQVVWMAPVVAAGQLVLVGVVLVLISKVKPSFVTLTRVATVYAFFAFMSLFFVYQRLYDYAVVLLAAGLAFQTGRIVQSRSEAFLRLRKRSIVWMVGAVGAAAVALNIGLVGARLVSISRLPDVDRDAPNILLLILDTVRAANMSQYGYERETSPILSSFAERGVLFENAIATAPWTLPSHVSIFTGRLPGEVSTSFMIPYDGEFPTLAEVLKQHGYETAAFVANRLYLGYETGVGRGFQRYDDYGVSLTEFALSSGMGRKIIHNPGFRRMVGHFDILGRKSAKGVTQGFLNWLNARSDQRPFFAFLNYNDAHEPYMPPPEFSREFSGPFQRRNDNSLFEMRRVVRTDRTELSNEGVQAELDAYDGAIGYIDQQIGVVLERLQQEGLLDNTVVIVASDHGEHFGEHGLHVHGNSVFLPVLHVPLFIVHGDRLPAGKRVREPVSIRDIPATALDLSGLRDSVSFPGSSLAGYWTGSEQSGADRVDSIVVSEYTDVTGDVTAKSVVMGKYHYFWGWGLVRLVHPETGQEVLRDMRFEALYDLAVDPHELHDLVPDTTMADVLAEARRRLAPHIIRDRSYRPYLPEWAYEAPASNADASGRQ